jgi:hypothetical protein
MKTALQFVLRNLLVGLICGIAGAFIFHLFYSKPKPVAIAFNGWHGVSFLKASCEPLQREYERVRSLPLNQQITLMTYSNNHFMPCLFPAAEMNVRVENELMTAFASNPACQGIKFFQGYYDPKDVNSEEGKNYLTAKWRLSLDLAPSSETGEVVLASSQWTLSPKSLSGSLADLDKASTQICRIAKGQGAE